jgi:acetylornithine deacetylase
MSTTHKQIYSQLRQLIETPSVSSTDARWDQGNRAVIDLLASWLSDLGFEVEIQAVTANGDKANLIATLGRGPGGLVLAGHTDTVPFDEGRWKSNPLKLSERDNRLYGLGSTDMKGFFPLAIAAASAFSADSLKQPLILLATADEESSMNGARQLAAAGRPKARAAIIGEPTSLVPVRMHKGIMMEAVRVTGQAGHSSDPALGNSALEGMHAVMGDLIAYRKELGVRYHHEFFNIAVPTLNLGCIHGGDSPNRICGKTELHFDLRMTPGEDNATVRAEI